MFNRSKYKGLLIILLIIMSLAVVGVMVGVGYRIYNVYYIKTGAEEAVKKFEEAVQTSTTFSKISATYRGFNVIGIIEIPTIDIKYPILKENNAESLKIAPALLYTAQGLNNNGNSVIVGSNNRNKTIFSDLKQLNNRDYIYLTNDEGINMKYKVYDIYTTQKDDNTYITRNTQGRKEICLTTNTDDGKEKIVILALEE